MGKLVARRMESGIGSEVVVIKMAGIESRREAAPNTATVVFRLVVGCCCARKVNDCG